MQSTCLSLVGLGVVDVGAGDAPVCVGAWVGAWVGGWCESRFGCARAEDLDEYARR